MNTMKKRVSVALAFATLLTLGLSAPASAGGGGDDYFNWTPIAGARISGATWTDGNALAGATGEGDESNSQAATLIQGTGEVWGTITITSDGCPGGCGTKQTTFGLSGDAKSFGGAQNLTTSAGQAISASAAKTENWFGGKVSTEMGMPKANP